LRLDWRQPVQAKQRLCAQNNAANGDELWQTAREERTKIQISNTTNEAAAAVQAFETTFDQKEERIYAHNIDLLILPVVDLGFAVIEACTPQG
jgi:outer membrane PBP1 activator LpoA protein